eukprot:CAMPEP_0114308074 /NCGR_PEP_ID=MMETSP0059-20121206/17852_1 /TAXON_ID=36894 /ORGANISM="Pyramimonas parkeae, Strain CCMP726" /LENGTH=974 /DNA_ID=CAMNT_0001431667 /DNA_START=143 /DNA_END=3068 /DNA_ORIENTATION=+
MMYTLKDEYLESGKVHYDPRRDYRGGPFAQELNLSSEAVNPDRTHGYGTEAGFGLTTSAGSSETLTNDTVYVTAEVLCDEFARSLDDAKSTHASQDSAGNVPSGSQGRSLGTASLTVHKMLDRSPDGAPSEANDVDSNSHDHRQDAPSRKGLEIRGGYSNLSSYMPKLFASFFESTEQESVEPTVEPTSGDAETVEISEVEEVSASDQDVFLDALEEMTQLYEMALQAKSATMQAMAKHTETLEFKEEARRDLLSMKTEVQAMDWEALRLAAAREVESATRAEEVDEEGERRRLEGEIRAQRKLMLSMQAAAARESLAANTTAPAQDEAGWEGSPPAASAGALVPHVQTHDRGKAAAAREELSAMMRRVPDLQIQSFLLSQMQQLAQASEGAHGSDRMARLEDLLQRQRSYGSAGRSRDLSTSPRSLDSDQAYSTPRGHEHDSSFSDTNSSPVSPSAGYACGAGEEVEPAFAGTVQESATSTAANTLEAGAAQAAAPSDEEGGFSSPRLVVAARERPKSNENATHATQVVASTPESAQHWKRVQEELAETKRELMNSQRDLDEVNDTYAAEFAAQQMQMQGLANAMANLVEELSLRTSEYSAELEDRDAVIATHEQQLADVSQQLQRARQQLREDARFRQEAMEARDRELIRMQTQLVAAQRKAAGAASVDEGAATGPVAYSTGLEKELEDTRARLATATQAKEQCIQEHTQAMAELAAQQSTIQDLRRELADLRADMDKTWETSHRQVHGYAEQVDCLAKQLKDSQLQAEAETRVWTETERALRERLQSEIAARQREEHTYTTSMAATTAQLEAARREAEQEATAFHKRMEKVETAASEQQRCLVVQLRSSEAEIVQLQTELASREKKFKDEDTRRIRERENVRTAAQQMVSSMKHASVAVGDQISHVEDVIKTIGMLHEQLQVNASGVDLDTQFKVLLTQDKLKALQDSLENSKKVNHDVEEALEKQQQSIV